MAITWDQIGAYYFHKLSRRVSPAATEVEDVTRRAVSGIAVRSLGTRGDEFELTGSTDVADTTAVAALYLGYKALQGTLVAIVIDGVTFSNYLVIGVEITDWNLVATPVGGINGGAYVVESQWKMRYGST